METRETENIRVEFIQVGDRQRHAPDDAVERLARSMAEIGLRTPITVRVIDEMEIDGKIVMGVPVLITGATRLAAARRLEWSHIECFIDDCNETDARLWEIAENLHRAELTALEHDEHVAEFKRLWAQKEKEQAQAEGILAQVEPKTGRGRPKGGDRAAARDLDLDRNVVNRAVRVDRLTPEAKDTARQLGLDNNRTALLDAAKHDTPEAQVISLRERAERPKAVQKPPLVAVWDAATDADRREFLSVRASEIESFKLVG